MNRHISLALTTGLLSALWAWTAVSLGLPSWAGFLGCTAWFASPKGGVTGFLTILFTLCSGVLWAQVIIAGSAVAPELAWLSYAMTGVVAFLMCLQARQTLLGFVPGTFIGACATFAGQGDWKNVLPALLLGLLFGVAMKCSGQWLAARAEPKNTTVVE
ncbi:DUF1097 domain-containing protein [Cronobacter turicensis]|uniref:DUF1097 domain-containing protein n=1 Tax=Cronobacter turicensis TaxID=413502 RepID=UPI00141340A2|nr:DUF1097 domain-containing protein [Cronobacter turicensis]NHV09133.1 DUF1097 domain-containing protein [Cronobacter turicensis]NHV61982.1 DUF1097 domain-containing protein [Cronobacter turicensis]NHW08923.1 DUF1097 domain-containing protein [Cronobacter turicensis]